MKPSHTNFFTASNLQISSICFSRLMTNLLVLLRVQPLPVHYLAMASVSKPGSHTVPEGRCLLCWPTLQEPPFQHVFQKPGSGQHVPRTKEAIIEALLSTTRNEKSMDELTRLSLKELRWYYQQILETRPHPGNPMVGISSLRKDQLLDLCAKHGIHFQPERRIFMAEMLSELRQHWECQCQVASTLSPPHVAAAATLSSSADEWSVVGDQGISSSSTPSTASAAEANETEGQSSVAKARAILCGVRDLVLKGLEAFDPEPGSN